MHVKVHSVSSFTLFADACIYCPDPSGTTGLGSNISLVMTCFVSVHASIAMRVEAYLCMLCEHHHLCVIVAFKLESGPSGQSRQRSSLHDIFSIVANACFFPTVTASADLCMALSMSLVVICSAFRASHRRLTKVFPEHSGYRRLLHVTCLVASNAKALCSVSL